MKQRMILEMISKLKDLDDESLEQVANAVNVCLIVQALAKIKTFSE